MTGIRNLADNDELDSAESYELLRDYHDMMTSISRSIIAFSFGLSRLHNFKGPE